MSKSPFPRDLPKYREISDKDWEWLSSQKEGRKIPTGLKSHEGATHLGVYHHPSGRTIVSPEGEQENAEPYAHSGHHDPEKVRDAYLKLMTTDISPEEAEPYISAYNKHHSGRPEQLAEGGTAHHRSDKRQRRAG